MGQSLKKFSPGSDNKKAEEIVPIIEKCYDTYFGLDSGEVKNLAKFYRAVCSTVDDINQKHGNTQFRVPDTEVLERAYEKHHKGKEKSLTKEEFEKILQDIITDTGFTGIGAAKDTLLYIFGVPVTALFIKQRVMPRAVPNGIFIPGVTSITVFILAALNKL